MHRYTKIVTKEMSKAELILKCVMSPAEPAKAFVDNYIRLMADYDINTFKMTIEMKGINKKSDVNNLIEMFKSRIPPSANASLASSQNNILVSEHQEQDSRLKQFDKLQELIRKKL